MGRRERKQLFEYETPALRGLIKGKRCRITHTVPGLNGQEGVVIDIRRGRKDQVLVQLDESKMWLWRSLGDVFML